MAGRFGPPRFGLFAFGWAALQPLRAAFWQFRFAELRALALQPVLLTMGLGVGLLLLSVVAAAPLQHALMREGDTLAGHAAWLGVRVLLQAVLAFGALLATLRLQGAVSGAAMERMSLFVQKRVTGTAPEPTIGAGRVLLNAVRSVVPSLKSLVLWVLTSLAAATLVLVPGVGPVLVVGAQAVVASAFLAHGAVTDSRGRLGLPRWLYVREPACLVGLTCGFLPFVLFPPLMLVGGGAVAISGTLVALGTRLRRAELEAGKAAPGAAR
jgi:uncharacterized protein involved in cysteine biosynthesis